MNLVRQEPEWVSGKRNSVTLSGAIQFGVLGESRSLAAGAVIAPDKGIPHDIQVLQDSELLLTIAKEVKWASAESGSGLPLPGLVKPVRGIPSSTSTSCSVLLLAGRVYTALLSRVES